MGVPQATDAVVRRLIVHEALGDNVFACLDPEIVPPEPSSLHALHERYERQQAFVDVESRFVTFFAEPRGGSTFAAALYIAVVLAESEDDVLVVTMSERGCDDLESSVSALHIDNEALVRVHAYEKSSYLEAYTTDVPFRHIVLDVGHCCKSLGLLVSHLMKYWLAAHGRMRIVGSPSEAAKRSLGSQFIAK